MTNMQNGSDWIRVNDEGIHGKRQCQRTTCRDEAYFWKGLDSAPPSVGLNENSSRVHFRVVHVQKDVSSRKCNWECSLPSLIGPELGTSLNFWDFSLCGPFRECARKPLKVRRSSFPAMFAGLLHRSSRLTSVPWKSPTLSSSPGIRRLAPSKLSSST